ncbi:MAG: hypothetical protein ACTIBK_13660 [Glutamicibacter arilaitensis]|uniref:hypothetical protein n=1 Tax=Glutamicibacter arilaitensis TaxID=256701 RepID=UPI003F90E4B1
MPVVKKPGADTLVYFWFAVGLAVLGMVIQQIGAIMMLNGALKLNILEVTTLHLVAWGCYTGALIFTIVVMHKAIAMLIYLVHHHRPLPPRTGAVIRDAPVTAQTPDTATAGQTPGAAKAMEDPLGKEEPPSGAKLKTFPRQALGAVQPQDQQQGAKHQNTRNGKDLA